MSVGGGGGGGVRVEWDGGGDLLNNFHFATAKHAIIDKLNFLT